MYHYNWPPIEALLSQYSNKLLGGAKVLPGPRDVDARNGFRRIVEPHTAHDAQRRTTLPTLRSDRPIQLGIRFAYIGFMLISLSNFVFRYQ